MWKFMSSFKVFLAQKNDNTTHIVYDTVNAKEHQHKCNLRMSECQHVDRRTPRFRVT